MSAESLDEGLGRVDLLDWLREDIEPLNFHPIEEEEGHGHSDDKEKDEEEDNNDAVAVAVVAACLHYQHKRLRQQAARRVLPYEYLHHQFSLDINMPAVRARVWLRFSVDLEKSPGEAIIRQIQRQLSEFSAGVRRIGGVDGVWGFVDGTFRGHCRPVGQDAQREVMEGNSLLYV
ncbi:hypothetical protein VC83_08269 [Pseudogymnoascus destructans]|uniref:Uncharacterized protein n=1 Tax=Pseudogymnoascus destructans TaxID=655981 RepID=A0A176ZZI4_9PEZI|nr:uncharacterized protein VC83_08269 [Pseudogymnoascus destructans]OAF55455.1 hypothetical protein VC83_08269 [Pseudogymnoascus destructans]